MRSSKRHRARNRLPFQNVMALSISIYQWHIISLGLAQVVSELSNEVATMEAKFVGADPFLHVKAFQRIGTQVLDGIPKGSTIFEYLAIEGFPDSSRCRCPPQFSPQRKGTEAVGSRKWALYNQAFSTSEELINERVVQTGLPQLN